VARLDRQREKGFREKVIETCSEGKDLEVHGI
jgi:hypothetical protein